MRMTSIRSRMTGTLFLAGIVVMGITGPVLGSQCSLRAELRDLACQISKKLSQAGESSISIGQVTGPPQLAASGGPMIKHVLSEELKQRGVCVKMRSKYGLGLRYRLISDAASGRHAVELAGEVSDLDGNRIYIFRRAVFGEEVIASVFGITCTVPSTADGSRDEAVASRVRHPAPPCLTTHIRSCEKTPYSIEMLVLDGSCGRYSTLKAESRDSLAFVSIGRNREYAIQVHNRSDTDAVVRVYIDGLSMFSFSKSREYTHVIVPARSSTLIKGWHRDNCVSNRFLVTRYADSPAARILQNTSDIGTVTVMFSAAWENEDDRPGDEPVSDCRRKSVNGTAVGKPVTVRYSEVSRWTGVVRSIVSVRYSR